MPTKFVAMLDVSDSTDDEVQFVPYVKPAPPVIELVESSSGGEETPGTEKKKKKKKRKRKDTAEYNEDDSELKAPLPTTNSLNDDEEIFISNSNCDDQTLSASGSNKATLLPTVSTFPVALNVDSISIDESSIQQVAVNGKDNVESQQQDGSSKTLDRNVEPSSTSSSLIRDSSVHKTLGSENVINKVTAIPVENGTKSISDGNSEEPLPTIRIASSIFESNDIALVEGPDVTNNVGNESGVSGGSNEKRIAAGTTKVTQSNSNTNKTKTTPRPRKKRQSANSRTNEEIFKFLTTLGVPFEDQDWATNSANVAPPKKPRRGKRKNDEGFEGLPISFQIPVMNSTAEETGSRINSPPMTIASLMAPPEVTSSRRMTPPISSTTSAPRAPRGAKNYVVPVPANNSATAFVSVTEETASKKSPKKRRNKNSATFLPTDPSQPESLTMQDVENASFSHKELDQVTLNLRTNVVFDQPPIPKQRQSNIPPEEFFFMDRCGREAPSQNQVQDEAEKETSRPQETESSTDMEVDNISVSINKGNTERTVRVETESVTLVEASRIAAIPFDESQSGAASESNANPTISEDIVIQDERPYLPSNWNKEMVDFYDTTKDADLSKPSLMKTISDDRRFWIVPFFPPKPKIKRIRCDNCKQWGHVTRQCPDPRKVACCILCGTKGHMAESKGKQGCPKSMCFNCGKSQPRCTSACKTCTYSRNPPICSLCNVTGHDEKTCPDNWRRFHSTTSVNQDFNDEGKVLQVFNGEKAQYVPKRELYCSNCGSKGHSYYSCKAHHRLSHYSLNKPIILKELNRNNETITADSSIKKPTPEVGEKSSSSSSSDRTVVVQESERSSKKKDKEKDDDGVETIKVQIMNKPTMTVPTSPVTNIRLPSPPGRSWKCINHPDCTNNPSLGNSCHTMFLMPADHKLLLMASNGDKIQALKNKHRVDICILTERTVAHIWGDNHVSAKEDIVRLIGNLTKLKKSVSDPLKHKKTVQSLNPIATSETKSEPPKQQELESINSPEVITLDEDEDEETPVPIADNILQVTLLNSEWELIFPESLTSDGIISQLSRQFDVNIFVCKSDLTATICDGTESGRLLAQQNMVYWLECKAGNVVYKMQYGLGDHLANHSKVFTKSNNNNNNNNKMKSMKRGKRASPKKNLNSKKRKGNSPDDQSRERGAGVVSGGGNKNRGENKRGRNKGRYFQQNPEYFPNMQIPPPDFSFRPMDFSYSAQPPGNNYNNNVGPPGNDFYGGGDGGMIGQRNAGGYSRREYSESRGGGGHRERNEYRGGYGPNDYGNNSSGFGGDINNRNDRGGYNNNRRYNNYHRRFETNRGRGSNNGGNNNRNPYEGGGGFDPTTSANRSSNGDVNRLRYYNFNGS